MLQKLIIPPDQESYNFLEGDEIIATSLEGGASKFRRDILNANIKVNVQWTLNKQEYNYMKVFYKILLESGSLAFLIDLYIDDPYLLTEHEAHFMPKTFGLKSQQGEAFIVGATLEVKPVDITQENIDSASLYALFGDQYQQYNDMFDTLINVEIPADIL